MDIKYIKKWPRVIGQNITYSFELVADQIIIRFNDRNITVYNFYDVVKHLKIEYVGIIINILSSVLQTIRKNKDTELITSNAEEKLIKNIKGNIMLKSDQIIIIFNDANITVYDFYDVVKHLKIEYVGIIINILSSILHTIRKNKTMATEYIKNQWPIQIKQNVIYPFELTNMDEKKLSELLNLVIIDDLTRLIREYLIKCIKGYIVLKFDCIVIT